MAHEPFICSSGLSTHVDTQQSPPSKSQSSLFSSALHRLSRYSGGKPVDEQLTAPRENNRAEFEQCETCVITDKELGLQ